MKQMFTAIAFGLAALSMSAHAADAAMDTVKAPTAQQSKMKSCNVDAKDKKGDERKAFMKECLSAKPDATAQQTKMKTCNAEAKDKKGEERKAFMKECLSAKKAA
jgi:hypothetical protein